MASSADDTGDDYLARHQRAKHEFLLVMLQCERDRFQRIERELAVLILSIDTGRDEDNAIDAWHTMTVHNRPNIAKDRLIDFPPMPRILLSNSDDDRDTSRATPSMMQCHTTKKKTSAREQRNCASKRPVVQQQRHVKRQLCGQTNRRMRHDNYAKRK